MVDPMTMDEYLFYYKAAHPKDYFSMIYVSNKWILVNSDAPFDGESPYFIVNNDVYRGMCVRNYKIPEHTFNKFYKRLLEYAILCD